MRCEFCCEKSWTSVQCLHSKSSDRMLSLTQRGIFKTIFRLARPAFFKIQKIKLQYYIVVDIVTHISRLKGVAEMTNKTKKSHSQL